MPSFDLVSEVDMHEVTNAVDQATREVTTRFDFKDTGSKFERDDAVITIVSQSEFQLRQMLDILQSKLTRRGVDIACLQVDDPEMAGKEARMKVTVRQGLDSDLCRRVVKEIKAKKLKVQAAIQGDHVRVSGKKRDDLQAVIAEMRKLEIGMPLQYVNFRD
jgi:hypothetical protein